MTRLDWERAKRDSERATNRKPRKRSEDKHRPPSSVQLRYLSDLSDQVEHGSLKPPATAYAASIRIDFLKRLLETREREAV